MSWETQARPPYTDHDLGDTQDAIMSQTILVVDDDTAVRQYLQEALSLRGYDVDTAGDAVKALLMFEEKEYALALVDVKMPGIDGIALLREIRRLELNIEVIILTAHATVETAVEAMKLGAYDYLTKPTDAAMLYLLVERAVEKTETQKRNQRLQAVLQRGNPNLTLVGESVSMQKLKQFITQAAAQETTVLIHGATGTGKEIIARSIHQQSSRRSDMFLPLNCATVPESLMASELFGHEKNSFTGASQTKIGIFEAADQGTLFLDELSEMPLPMQANLLRTLESGEFRRVGSNHIRYTNARIVAATNKDLQAEIEAGRFRPDLFYRLSIMTIEITPLRNRKDDIPLLAHHFLAEAAKRYRKPCSTIASNGIRLLQDYTWPGNVRELKNIVERAVLVCSGTEITCRDLDFPLASQQSDVALDEQYGSTTWTLEELEKHHIKRVFERNQGRRDLTADQLGIPLRTLYRKLRKYEIV